MKQKSKRMNICFVLIALALLFLLCINVAYAYFSAQNTISSNSKMGVLNFGWATQNTTFVGLTTEIVPNTTSGEVSRGESFGFKVKSNSEVINSSNKLGFVILQGSVDAYIRIWVDAYEKNNDGTLADENFGQYFELLIEEENIIYNGNKHQSGTNEKGELEENNIYYLKFEQPATYPSNIADYFIYGLKLSETAPLKMLEKDFKITISFDAVQVANEAYLSVFTDWRGYSDSWR